SNFLSGGVWDWGKHAEPSLRHRPRNGLDIDKERLELRRLRIRVADERRERIRRRSLAGDTDEAEMDRHADGVHGLAVDLQRLQAFGDNGLPLDRTAVRPDADHASVLDPLLPCKFFRYLHE